MGKSEVNAKKNCFVNFRKGTEMNFLSPRDSEEWRRRKLWRKRREKITFVLF